MRTVKIHERKINFTLISTKSKKNKRFQYVIGDCEPWCYDRKKKVQSNFKSKIVTIKVHVKIKQIVQSNKIS